MKLIPGMTIIRKEKLRPIPLMNIDAKNLNPNVSTPKSIQHHDQELIQECKGDLLSKLKPM